MKDDTDKSILPLLICIGLYLILGFFIRINEGPIRWYHELVFAPLGIITLMMNLISLEYIEYKLCKWGMYKNKANGVALGIWSGFLFLWYIVFIAPSIH